VDIPTRTIISEQKVTIETFRPEQLQVMYQLPFTSKFSHNSEFLESFKQKECEKYDRSMSDMIKDWVSYPAKLRADGNGVYSISSLEPQFKYIAMMACRLYGREDTTHLFLPWVPLIHTVTGWMLLRLGQTIVRQSYQLDYIISDAEGIWEGRFIFYGRIHHGLHLFHDAFTPNELELESI
jgi:hypothetical protein